MRFAFITREKACYPLRLLCRVMEVALSGDYAWRQRLTTPPSPKRQSVAVLIRACYFEHRRRDGTRRIQAALYKAGTKVGRWQIRRVLREQQLCALQPKAFRPRTTEAKGVQAAPHLLRPLPLPTTAGQVLVGDITYLPVRQGRWCYLAMWQDWLTRRIVGWSVATTMSAALVTTALHKAWQQGLVQRGEEKLSRPAFRKPC